MRHVAYLGRVHRIEWASDGAKLRGKEYFDGLRDRDRAKFEAKFRLMGDRGTLHREQFNNEGDGIYAFKIWKHRMLCFFYGGALLITHGFSKKQDKMPPKELAKAKRIRTAHLEGGK